MARNKYTLVVTLILTMFSTTNYADFDDKQKQEIGTVVHDYLISHPEVITEAIQSLQTKEMQNWLDTTKAAIKNHIDDIFKADNSPTAGATKPTITLVEYFDYNCPHCKRMDGIIKNIIAENKNVQVIFRQLPIFGEPSVFAAKAALAANKQNKFTELHEKLLAYPSMLSEDTVLELAKEAGLDVEKLKKDMEDPKIQEELQKNQRVAGEIGLRGTPAFIIGSYPASKDMQIELIPGETTQEELTKLINSIKQ